MQQPPGSARRQGSHASLNNVMRSSSPRSPERAGSYESVEGSEEEDHLLPSNDEDNNYDDFEDDEQKNGNHVVDGERNGGSELVSAHVSS